MKIETKFDVGDLVYTAVEDDNLMDFWSSGPHEITRIGIGRDGLRYYGSSLSEIEEDIFSTEKEAQREADRRTNVALRAKMRLPQPPSDRDAAIIAQKKAAAGEE